MVIPKFAILMYIDLNLFLLIINTNLQLFNIIIFQKIIVFFIITTLRLLRENDRSTSTTQYTRILRRKYLNGTHTNNIDVQLNSALKLISESITSYTPTQRLLLLININFPSPILKDKMPSLEYEPTAN